MLAIEEHLISQMWPALGYLLRQCLLQWGRMVFLSHLQALGFICFAIPLVIFYPDFRGNFIRVTVEGGSYQAFIKQVDLSFLAMVIDDRVFAEGTVLLSVVYYFVFWNSNGVWKEDWTDRLG